MHIMLLSSIQRLPLIRLINIRQNIPLGMPRKQFLRITTLDTIRLSSLFSVVDLKEVAIAASSKIVPIRSEWSSPELTIRAMRKHSLTDNLRNRMNLQQWILRSSRKSLIIPRKHDVGYPSAMRNHSISNLLIIISTIHGYISIVASEYLNIYSPPARNKTESERSQAIAQT
jgi:hypothetical protein